MIWDRCRSSCAATVSVPLPAKAFRQVGQKAWTYDVKDILEIAACRLAEIVLLSVFCNMDPPPPVISVPRRAVAISAACLWLVLQLCNTPRFLLRPTVPVRLVFMFVVYSVAVSYVAITGWPETSPVGKLGIPNHQVCGSVLNEELTKCNPALGSVEVVKGPERMGDIPHSQANISKSQTLLGYEPSHDLSSGIREAAEWYFKNLKNT